MKRVAKSSSLSQKRSGSSRIRKRRERSIRPSGVPGPAGIRHEMSKTQQEHEDAKEKCETQSTNSEDGENRTWEDTTLVRSG